MQTVPAPTRTLSTLELLARFIQIESLTISRDAMPHHYVAHAVILDLQPTQMVAAIMATEDAITATYPLARRSGWRATSDGLTIYFYAWTPIASSDWHLV